jgi:hypothetical protein
MNTEQANRYLDGFQINDRSIYDSQDNEHPLDCLLEDYHQEQLKLLGISSVVKSLCEHHWVNAKNIAVKSGQMCVKCHSVKA